MKKQYSIAEAKNKLTTLIHEAEAGLPVSLTRHGKPVAVLMAIQEYQALKTNKHNFWDLLTEFREYMGSSGVEYNEADFSGIRDSSSGREVDF
ncbi:MAG: type II toxin-antitoxin system Phd/YefM family antitoxin [Desulfobacteraceae bacterium]|nr:type II toxin-antitoxin system Phd/YefM family antitoxin [Desulfobacteraceae bacterium]